MDAQQSGKAASQHRLKRQWQPTHKQAHRNTSCQGVSVARQPSAGYSAEQWADYSLHKTLIGGEKTQMKGTGFSDCV